MSRPAVTPEALQALAPEVVEGVRLLPVVHARLDLAGLVRAVLEVLRPAAVAVEIPTTLARSAERAVARLPSLSLILSEEPGEDEALVWLVTPSDPFVEALRWAQKNDARRFYIDPDVRYLERHVDPVPDTHALWELGPAEYLARVREVVEQGPIAPADEVRERGMAYHVQRARQSLDNATLLVLVGLAHADRVASYIEAPQAVPLARPVRHAVELRHLHPASLTAVLREPPLAQAAFWLLRDASLPAEPNLDETLSKKVSLLHHGLHLITGGKDTSDAIRRDQLALLAAHRAAATRYGFPQAIDRQRLGQLVWQVAAGSYEEQTQEAVRPWQQRLFFDFVRRYSRVNGQLVAGLYEWVVAARGVGDDNLAWEVFDAARTYPWQTEDAEIPVAKVDGDMLDLGTRRVRFRRRFFRVKQRLVRVPVRERHRDDDPDKWLEGFENQLGLCSYPPEDIVIEDYGRFLQRKAVSLLSAERKRTEPFSTSLLDGIDVRETMRNLHEGRIYVHEMGRAPGDAGSVIVIFDRDLDHARFPYLMTWLGEHDQESDMAFYASNPGQQVVGPGITRATYGAFMMTMPPGRLYDVWRDPEYAVAHEKAEVLIMAAVDYSTDTLVVHVAAEPPSERMRHYASQRKRRLVHIPLGTLSPVTLKKIRVVHLLAGHDKRGIARDYIW